MEPFLEFVTFFRNMSAGDAKIGQPAPAFNAQALVNGEFKQVQLADFKGFCFDDCVRATLTFCSSQANMWCFSSTHLTSPLSAPLRSLLSPRGLSSSRRSVARLLPVQLVSALTQSFESNLYLDSVFSHLAWTNTPRKEGGLGAMKIPILADTNHAISKAYGCLKEDEGIAYRGLYIIDRNGQ